MKRGSWTRVSSGCRANKPSSGSRSAKVSSRWRTAGRSSASRAFRTTCGSAPRLPRPRSARPARHPPLPLTDVTERARRNALLRPEPDTGPPTAPPWRTDLHLRPRASQPRHLQPPRHPPSGPAPSPFRRHLPRRPTLGLPGPVVVPTPRGPDAARRDRADPPRARHRASRAGCTRPICAAVGSR